MLKKTLLSFIFCLPCLVFADTLQIEIHRLNFDPESNGIGESLGTIRLQDGDLGLIIQPDLHQVAPGFHGFHVHVNPACGAEVKDGALVPGLAAGGHFDPDGTGQHAGPYDKSGHQGDLPPLYCDIYGSCNQTTLAPKLKVKDILGRSLIIHEHGDNFSDAPEPLGGGGARIGCGVIQPPE